MDLCAASAASSVSRVIRSSRVHLRFDSGFVRFCVGDYPVYSGVFRVYSVLSRGLSGLFGFIQGLRAWTSGWRTRPARPRLSFGSSQGSVRFIRFYSGSTRYDSGFIRFDSGFIRFHSGFIRFYAGFTRYYLRFIRVHLELIGFFYLGYIRYFSASRDARLDWSASLPSSAASARCRRLSTCRGRWGLGSGERERGERERERERETRVYSPLTLHAPPPIHWAI